MTQQAAQSTWTAVQKRYARFARQKGISCCRDEKKARAVSSEIGKTFGYSETELQNAPENANLGLGCGNPLALGSLQPGESVLDLGSGGGFDCFLAVRAVGATGSVIGVDMTPEMLALARRNAEQGGYSNVEFREGHIEALPVSDTSVDVVLSNCVVNLSPDKAQVFREAFRVLKPGGRLFVSDIVLLRPLPGWVRGLAARYADCVANAALRDDYLAAICAAGFEEPRELGRTTYSLESLKAYPEARLWISLARWLPGAAGTAASVASVQISAIKPR